MTLPSGAPSAKVDGTGTESSVITRWRQVEELFHRAAEAPKAEREALVRAAAGDDEALAAEVLELLAASSSVEEKLRMGSGSQQVPQDVEEEAAEALVGAHMGDYRLERVLGHGGMGVVYLAHAASTPEVPVAIKVVRRLLRSSPALQQFLLERDTLARLEHPHIARLLDGGVSADGLPYVVMEYVQGQRLDTACEAPGVSAEDVMRYMLQLCEAVSYVHRNLKPGNVMVTGQGSVKLLDFGTLKSMEPTAADSALTRAGMRPVTLRYSSPEYLRGEAVSVASEVYSLGVVLYRLLSGQTPFGPGRLPTTEYLQRLQTGSAQPPSRAAEARPKPACAPWPRTSMRSYSRACYEPTERYPTVDALAEDLRRALDGRPVEARGGALRYRAAKFYARNRGSLWTVAAAVFILVVGTAAMARQGRIARADQQRAQRGVERERQLAHLLLFGCFNELQQMPGSTDAQRQAVGNALHFLDELYASAPGDAVRLESVRAYTAMGQLQGSPYYQNRGDAPGGLNSLNKALPAAEALVRSNPGNADYRDGLVAAQMVAGQLLMGMSKPRQALVYLQAAAKTTRM